MSIGICGKIWGKGVDLFIGKKAYTHTFRLLTVSGGDLDDLNDFTLISISLAVRW